MKIKLIRNIVANGSPKRAGDVIDVEPREARYLCGINKAEYHNEDDKPKEKVLTAENFFQTAPRGGKRAKGST